MGGSRRPARRDGWRIAVGLLDRQRKQIAPGLDLDAAEDGMRLLLGGFGQFVVARAPSAARLPSAAETHTTLQRLPGRGTNTQGPAAYETRWRCSCAAGEWAMLKVSAD